MGLIDTRVMYEYKYNYLPVVSPCAPVQPFTLLHLFVFRLGLRLLDRFSVLLFCVQTGTSVYDICI
jgi:hypothetical protein